MRFTIFHICRRLVLLMLCLPFFATGQRPADTISRRVNDDTAKSAIDKKIAQIRQVIKDELVKSKEKFEEEKLEIRQTAGFAELRRLSQQAKLLLKNGVDTVSVHALLDETQTALTLVKDGITTNKGSYQTQRNLEVSASLLTVLGDRINRMKSLLDKRGSMLAGMQQRADSLSTDSAMYAFTGDSAGLVAFVKKAIVIGKESSRIDSMLKLTISSVRELVFRYDTVSLEIQTLAEEIELYSDELAGQELKKEFPYLWEPISVHRSFSDIIKVSARKESLLLLYYVSDNKGLIILVLALTVLSYAFIRVLKKQLILHNRFDTENEGQLLVRHSLASAVLITWNIFQFIFYHPPFIFSFIIWLTSAICLAVLFKNYITPFWFRFWMVLICFLLLAGLNNMLLQVSREGRLFHLLLSVSAAVYCGSMLFTNHKKDLREKNIVYFIGFVCACLLLAALLNATGRFNLAQTVMTGGLTGIVISIVFLWVARLLNAGLLLASGIYSGPSRKSFFINFSRVGDQVPMLFNVLLVIGWLFLVARNFYSFRKIYDPFVHFLTEPRSVGNYDFTLSGILWFIAILVLSVFLSRLVSFFAGEPAATTERAVEKKRAAFASWLLLVRIFIICMGLFFAFAALGISLDRITIIFGALGVGIGLGLQGLVNNLVSGIVLSFERPVNVGDIIEVNGKSGTMKSIGFRSSVITSSEGASIVIPNGELLNQHLVNWTKGHNLRRNVVTVGVAYGSDLEKVKRLVLSMLQGNEAIHTYPAPDVLFRQFGSNSIDVDIVFWPRDINASLKLRSDIIAAVSAAFAAEGITIPFAQTDLHIKSMPDGYGKPVRE